MIGSAPVVWVACGQSAGVWPLDLKGCLIFSDETFFPGRCAQVIANGKPIGIMGVLHPDVIHNFDLNLPCAVLELDVEEFL